MAKFKVIRYKRYVAEVSASCASEAHRKADDIPGAEWRLIEDRVDSFVGLDNVMKKFKDSNTKPLIWSDKAIDSLLEKLRK